METSERRDDRETLASIAGPRLVWVNPLFQGRENKTLHIGVLAQRLVDRLGRP